MSSKRGAWISRRGQTDADHAIDQVIERQPQAGEQVQQLPDEQIEDSPYQARQPSSDASVEDLAQGMREAGFQGVLIVRLHGDPAKRRRGLVQLVYGHRRRAAWRQICAELGQSCQLPVVVREISDEQMLTIGAQENLQRQDLDPVEEAQIVAWHEQVFFDRNQAQLGAMLGKSSDWVSVRSRIHKLPDRLKDCLRQRPRAIAQILELGPLFTQQPNLALALADRVVQENLTLARIRALVRGYERPEVRAAAGMGLAERRGAATKVQEFTKLPVAEHSKIENAQSTAIDFQDAPDKRDVSEPPQGQNDLPAITVGEFNLPAHSRMPAVADEALLQQATKTITSLASRAERLSINEFTGQLLDQLETALSILRRAFTEYSSGEQ
jgi:ParB family chromosome partitioning protein